MKRTTSNFLGLPDMPLDRARFVILPIPFEETTSCQKGTERGPAGIIFASRYLEFYDEEMDTEPCAAGIKTLPAVKPDSSGHGRMISKISRTAGAYFGMNKVVVGLGGEHTVSAGLVDACIKRYPDINVLSFDAHGDLRDTYQGTRFSHACVARRISELGCNLFSVGIRSISTEEKDFLKSTERVKIFWGYQMAGKRWGDILNRTLPPGMYYITFDVDFLDPSVIPDTGTPEPGGFQWYETVDFLKTFITRKDIGIAGFDVVELSPPEKFTHSSFLAAKLIYKIIGFISSKN